MGRGWGAGRRLYHVCDFITEFVAPQGEDMDGAGRARGYYMSYGGRVGWGRMGRYMGTCGVGM